MVKSRGRRYEMFTWMKYYSHVDVQFVVTFMIKCRRNRMIEHGFKAKQNNVESLYKS